MFLLSLATVLRAHEAQSVSFETDDAVTLAADYWTPVRAEGDTKPAPVAILLHMYQSDRSAWRPLVPALEHAGFAILAIDLRGHGGSPGPAARSFPRRVLDRDPALFNSMHRDVAAARAWLKGRPEVDLERQVLVGASVGCSIAIDFARRHQDIDAIALLTPGSKYLGVDSLGHISGLGDDTRVLMLSSREEAGLGVVPLCTRVAPSSSSELNAALTKLKDRAADQVEVVVPRAADAKPIDVTLFAPGGTHGTRMLDKVDGVEEHIATFLKNAVAAKKAPAAAAP